MKTAIKKVTATKEKVAPAKVEPTKPPKAKPAKPVVVEEPQPVVETPTVKIENTNGTSPRMVAIHHMWTLLQESPISVEQLVQQIASRLVNENKMEAEAATKLATSACNHQLPFETGQRGRKTIRVRTIKGGKLEWCGGAIRRRKTA